jgi:hypothetical protein
MVGSDTGRRTRVVRLTALGLSFAVGALGSGGYASVGDGSADPAARLAQARADGALEILFGGKLAMDRPESQPETFSQFNQFSQWSDSPTWPNSH